MDSADPRNEPFALLLVLGAKGVSRIDRLRELLKAAWPGRGFVVTLDGLGLALFEEIFRPADPTVTTSRCSNGREEAATPSLPSQPPVTGAEPSGEESDAR